MDYDHWREIHFRADKSLWRNDNLPFEVQFFHPGLFYNHLVNIYVVDQSGVHLFPYDRRLFDFGKNEIPDKIPI